MAPDAQSGAELTVSQAATMLGISRHTVYRLIREGVLCCRRVGLPSSRRPTYRVLADEVSTLQRRYERQTSQNANGSPRKALQRITTNDLKFIRLRI
jgi:excisionase family DNA binding protein